MLDHRNAKSAIFWKLLPQVNPSYSNSTNISLAVTSYVSVFTRWLVVDDVITTRYGEQHRKHEREYRFGYRIATPYNVRWKVVVEYGQ